MDGTAFVRLIENAALLLVLVFVYDYLVRFLRRQTLAFKVVTGVVLGGISVAVMLLAWRLPNGTIFDTRSVVLSMGTLFYGTVPGIIGGAIAGVYRAVQGGPGAPMGVAVIVMSVGRRCGLAAAPRHRPPRPEHPRDVPLRPDRARAHARAHGAAAGIHRDDDAGEDRRPRDRRLPAGLGGARTPHGRPETPAPVGAGAARERGALRRVRRPDAGLPLDPRPRAALRLREPAARRAARPPRVRARWAARRRSCGSRTWPRTPARCARGRWRARSSTSSSAGPAGTASATCTPSSSRCTARATRRCSGA